MCKSLSHTFLCNISTHNGTQKCVRRKQADWVNEPRLDHDYSVSRSIVFIFEINYRNLANLKIVCKKPCIESANNAPKRQEIRYYIRMSGGDFALPSPLA